MSLKYIQKGKLYNSENYNFEIKEYFTTIDNAIQFIERLEEEENKAKFLGWLKKYDDSTIVEHDYYDITYNTLCLYIRKGKLFWWSGGFGFKTTRRTTNFLNQIYYDEGEVIILKLIINELSEYIEDIDVDISYDKDMYIVDEHEEVGEELEGEEHVDSDE